MPSLFRISAAVAALALAPIAVRAVGGPQLITCLTIPQETAPPGGTAQVKVFLTEPKPISTGDMAFSFGDFGDFAGIGLFSPGNDTLGVAVVRGSAMTVSIVSSSATFGTDHQYPMLTVSGRVPAKAKVGTMIPIGILGEGLRLLDPSGAVYSMKELTSGSIVVAPGLSIDEVSPGSADLPAGSVVRITGQGFTPDTQVRFRHTEVMEVHYVDSSNLDVVLASPTRMHGLKIDAYKPGGSRTTYYSYQRTTRQDTSVDPILRDVVPLFSSETVTAALVGIAAVPTGLALQNLESSPALVNVELLAPDGQPLAATTLRLAEHRFVVKEISELFDVRYAPSLLVRVTSLTPIQVMGVTVDPSGAVTPVVPRQPIADVPVVSPSDNPPAPADVPVAYPSDNQTELIPDASQPVTCLTIPDETAPPGGFAQVKVFLTEPKPISTGDMAFSFGDFGDFAGIGLFSPGNDTLGAAVVRGSAVAVSIVSSSATFGTDHDYPMLTVAGRVPATAKVGTMIPIGILGEGLRLFDPSGAVYSMKKLQSGSVEVAPGLSIDEVSPGSADLPAGSVVRITGQGFTPGTRVHVRQTDLAEVRYIDSENLDVVLDSPTRMHGLKIEAANPDGSQTTYYSYQRTRRQDTSVDPILRDVVPLFSFKAVIAALVDIGAVPTGVALQNLESSPALVNVELLAPDGQPLAATTLRLAEHRFVVKQISELFGVPYAPSMVLRVTSLTPIQVMGVAVDPSGAVTPVVPRQTIADVPVVTLSADPPAPTDVPIASPSGNPPAPTDAPVVSPSEDHTGLSDVPEVDPSEHQAALPPALLAGRADLPFAAESLPTGQQPVTCITILDETAPPGGFAQVKVFLTEPKPISTGDMAFSFGGFGDFAGIGLFSPGNDTLGVAVVRGSAVAVSIVSSSATFGTDHDYPMLTVAGRVPAMAPLGTTIPIGILGEGLRLLDPSGAVYSMKELTPGSIVVAPGLSIDEVSPGSADLPAGSVVRITGQGFTPDTQVHFRHAEVVEVHYVDSSNLDVVLASPMRMHGLEINAHNPGGSQTTYYSYQRTKRQDTSVDSILRDVVPLFSSEAVTAALADIAAVPTGLALQNLESSPALVHVELLAPDGQPLAATTLRLAEHRFVVEEISELFDVPYAASMVVRVTSVTPIQVMGVTVDPSGAVAPVVPRRTIANVPVVSPSDNPSALTDGPAAGPSEKQAAPADLPLR